MNLTHLSLVDTAISKEAMILLFSKLASTKTLKLRKLDLGRHPPPMLFSNLPAVDPEIFASAICKLKEVDVQYNNLSYGQLSALFMKMMIYQHSLETLVLSYNMNVRLISESVVTQALLTVKSIEFFDLGPRHFKHFIEKAKVTPCTKTRYIQIRHGSMSHQRRLEAALAQNERIRFKPHRTHPQMVGWSETTEYDDISPLDDLLSFPNYGDDDDVFPNYGYDDDDDDYELDQFMMNQLMNGL